MYPFLRYPNLGYHLLNRLTNHKADMSDATVAQLCAKFEVPDLERIGEAHVLRAAETDVAAQLANQHRTVLYVVAPISRLAVGIIAGAPGAVLGVIGGWYLLVSTVNGFERWSKRRTIRQALYVELIAAKAQQLEGEPLAFEARHRLRTWSPEHLARLWLEIGHLRAKPEPVKVWPGVTREYVPIARRVLASLLA